MTAMRRVGPYEVKAVGLGCMSLSHAYGEPPAEDYAERLLHRALDLGYDFLDTAALYGQGHNERLIGRVLRGRRDEFVLASKCGILITPEGQRKIDGRPEAVRQVLDESLRRLGVDHIDLYYLHRRDPGVPIEESVGALKEAVEAGKIGAIGLSEVSADTLRRANTVHPIAALQTEYSLWTRNPEIAVLDACRELGTAFVAFSPVGRGFLADAVHAPAELLKSDIRTMMPRFIDPAFSANLKMLDDLRAIAHEIGCTPAQLSIAWLLQGNDDVVPIPGTASIAHMEDNFAAADISLSAAVMRRLDTLIDRNGVHGQRYSPAMQAQVETEEFC